MEASEIIDGCDVILSNRQGECHNSDEGKKVARRRPPHPLLAGDYP